MKLKILAKIIEKIFGMADNEDEPRADMYLPDRLLAMSLIFLIGGAALAVYSAVDFAIWAVIFAVFGIGLGIGAFRCWKNQTIRMISEEEFTLHYDVWKNVYLPVF